MRRNPLLALLAACALVACDPAEPPDTDTTDAEQFVATLGPGNVVGQTIESSASGAATLSWDASAMAFAIDVESISQVIMAHIHGPAGTEQNADIIVTLFAPDGPTGTVNGRLVAGSVTPGSSLITPGFTLETVLDLMRAGQAYVLVHTSTYPDGEIRGQVALQP